MALDKGRGLREIMEKLPMHFPPLLEGLSELGSAEVLYVIDFFCKIPSALVVLVVHS